MRLLRYLLSGVCCLALAISVCNLDVSATYTTSQGIQCDYADGHDKTFSEDDLNSFGLDADKNVQYVWGYLKTNGFTDIAAASVIGSFYLESSCTPWAGEADGNSGGYIGRGVAQWTPSEGNFGKECHADLAEYASKSSHKHENKTPTTKYNSLDEAKADGNTWLTCLECQMGFFVSDPSAGNKVMTNCSTYYKLPEGVNNLPMMEGFAKFDFVKNYGNEEKGLIEACDMFCLRWEVPAKGTAHMRKRQQIAKKVLELYAGTTVNLDSGELVDTSGGVIADLSGMGSMLPESFFIGEGNSLSESRITLMSASDLSYSERSEINNWKSTIDLNKQDNYYHIPRTVFMFIGILLVLYSVILYLSFQFDRVNNFIDIELLNMFTLGRLRTSVDETSNYADHSARNKVVGHKDMATITITGILIGVLLISGKLFAILLTMIHWLGTIL